VWPPEAKVPPSSAPAPRNGPPHAAPAAPAVDRPVVLAASPVLSGAQLPVHADALPKPAAAASHSASAASAAPLRGRVAAAAAPAAAPAADVALVRSQVAQQVQQAWSSLQRGELVQAEGVYRQVLSDKPDDPDAALGLAVALHRQKKWEDAWNAYQRSMQLWPDNPMAQTGMLAILSETDASTAVSRLQEWVATRPRDAAAHAALARLWAKQSKWAEALPLLQRAYTLEPHQVSHVVNLAVALDQLRRYPEAIAHYRMALQTGVSGVPLTTIQARLDQLEASSSP
jgi:Flp pilus assembly protein TadD